ncbi:MAG: formyltetrahydrofolate deformylase [Candidatus Omnitrophota bacterium]
MSNAILLISCPDKKGITAAVSQFIYVNGGNIEHADQHIDHQSNTFFMRVEWSLEGFKIKKEEISSYFNPIAKEFNMSWSLYFTDQTPRAAIFVSKYMHCLYDLLLRYKAGQFSCQIPLIISNHPQAKEVADKFGVKFLEFAISPDNKVDQEKRQIDVLNDNSIDLIVLARYTQILTSRFISDFPNRIINIHHSFLPAFVGKNPYQRAYRKGVKIIGATSHYVTEELDAGPIIEQDITRVSHRDCLDDLIREGQDLEKVVLSRAVRWHLERKILVYNNKTVVFD